MSKHKKSKGKSLKQGLLDGWRGWLVVVAVLAVGLTSLNWVLNNILFQPVPNPSYGVSFSVKQAKIYKNDWQQFVLFFVRRLLL